MILKIIIVVFGLLIICWSSFFGIMLIMGPIVTGFRKAPYVPSFNEHLRVMKKHLKLEPGATIVDLWCGDGKALRFFNKEFGLIGTWYDINPFVLLYGRVNNRLLWFKNITFVRSNFKKAPLKRYEYIYMYLFPNQMISIEDRVFDNIGEHNIIISNSFVFVNHEPFEIINDDRNKRLIYLYRK